MENLRQQKWPTRTLVLFCLPTASGEKTYGLSLRQKDYVHPSMDTLPKRHQTIMPHFILIHLYVVTLQLNLCGLYMPRFENDFPNTFENFDDKISTSFPRSFSATSLFFNHHHLFFSFSNFTFWNYHS